MQGLLDVADGMSLENDPISFEAFHEEDAEKVGETIAGSYDMNDSAISEIESIGDSCYNLARTVNRKRTGGNDFTEKQYEHIHQMMQLTENALKHMVAIVEDDAHVVDVNHSFNIENEMNNYRSQLKNQNILDVNNKEYDYQMGVHYMDLIGECEKLGDYVVNVVEARTNVKEKKTNENR